MISVGVSFILVSISIILICLVLNMARKERIQLYMRMYAAEEKIDALKEALVSSMNMQIEISKMLIRNRIT